MIPSRRFLATLPIEAFLTGCLKSSPWIGMRILVLVLISFIVPIPFAVLAADSEPSGEITVLHAASLSDLFRKSRTAFERLNPKVKIHLEPGGSLILIRKITDLEKEADVIAVADRSLIPAFLMPHYVEKSVDFLTEQMTLIVAENAKYADVISADNWPDILLRPEVDFGISNPDKAPVGYRTLLVWKLAEQHYEKPGLHRQLIEILKQRNIRQNASALMTLLKVGELDYAFNYASLAKQNGFRTIPLPSEINLGDLKLSQWYRTVSVEVPGDRPNAKNIIQGEPILYSMGRLKDSRSPETAQAFIDFLLGPKGQSLMLETGLTPIALAPQ